MRGGWGRRGDGAGVGVGWAGMRKRSRCGGVGVRCKPPSSASNYQCNPRTSRLNVYIHGTPPPPALQGVGTRSGIEMSPVKIVKNPDGSLQRAAMTQSALAKERRELKEQQQRTLLEAIPKDLSRPWEDPMADPSERRGEEAGGRATWFWRGRSGLGRGSESWVCFSDRQSTAATLIIVEVVL